jgi:hypothetical protein
VPEPLLNRAQINPRPEAPSGEGSSKLVQQEILILQLRALSDSFHTVEKIQLRITPAVGNTRLHRLSDFAFHAFRLSLN